MKILIANKFYYNRGGDCVASIALETLLKEKGHKVAFFSMQHPLNFHSEWEHFFPSSVNFQTNNLQEKLKATIRIFYSLEVKNKFLTLIERFKPDVVHLNNIHSQLSPIIGEIAHKKGIKVIWTLHDYKLVCPNYTCLKNGQTCTLCIDQRDTCNVLQNRCMKNSYAASLLAYWESLVWNKKRMIKNTDYFIAPSQFMKGLMQKGGFPDSKIEVIPNFTNRNYSIVPSPKSAYYCFVGRLSKEKGLDSLVHVASQLPYKLIIIGSGPMANQYPNMNHIEFIGFKEWKEMAPIIQKAKFIVIPSEWYEVFGLVSIEAQCLGTPVLGANIGGIPETINAPQNGLLFEPRDKDDLKEKIIQMFQTSFDYNKISQEAQERFSADNYYKEIIKIYEQ